MFTAEARTQIRFFAWLLFATTLGLAQDRGAVRGTVTDQSGAAVPEAVVTARNLNTGLTQSAKTGLDGVYNVTYLPPSQSLAVDRLSIEKSSYN
jgi:hypothetical protein